MGELTGFEAPCVECNGEQVGSSLVCSHLCPSVEVCEHMGRAHCFTECNVWGPSVEVCEHMGGAHCFTKYNVWGANFHGHVQSITEL